MAFRLELAASEQSRYAKGQSHPSCRACLVMIARTRLVGESRSWFSGQARVTYGNGETDKENVDLTRIDGRWMITPEEK